ncbi:MAG: ABC transporter ATP-binding protein [Chthonomonas sp.]|nr:ABC transporter ATP-binding protein [Chthonomonas sp.]
MIELRQVRKEFRLSHSGSFKTALLWWRRKRIEQFEVLKGIDLQIKQGECVALVGRNGAGKSTLLSLLSRIYKPTSGEIVVRGKIAPLLELGAGFHPDLSGLENILFNGVILGLTRQQVQERIDSIVEFSELRNHIDAPVRSYSSGMLARLGFAIAVHVDAEILIVDEVLAVGDFAFEEKCYKRIQDFKEQGGTILFVSHEMDDIRRVADRCVWLKNGQIRLEGAPDDVIRSYQADSEATESL